MVNHPLFVTIDCLNLFDHKNKMKQIMCSAYGQDFLHMVVWAILKNVKLQDFCSILKACIEKVS